MHGCGEDNWTVAIEREKGLSGLAADVRWESPSSALADQTTASRITGFSVILGGEWRMGLGHSVAFTKTAGVVGGSPHDCPYPFR